MAQVKVDAFVLDVKKCLEECKQAVLQCLETYKKTKLGVESMSPEEEKAFLKEAFVFIYNESDKQWDAQDKFTPQFLDEMITGVLISQGVELLFKKV